MEENRMIAAFMGYEFVTVGYFDTEDETQWQRENREWMDEVGIEDVGDYFVDTKDNSWFPAEEADYHKSWDALMPVVEKIEKEGCEVVIGSQMEWINDDQDIVWHQDVSICQDIQEICNVTAKTKIEAVYSAVLSFLKWYNENQNHKHDRQ
jgi:hypothetical protein